MTTRIFFFFENGLSGREECSEARKRKPRRRASSHYAVTSLLSHAVWWLRSGGQEIKVEANLSVELEFPCKCCTPCTLQGARSGPMRLQNGMTFA